VRCYLRPGLREFLEAASEIADVVLFTAGLPGYASPLCDALDPQRTLLPVRLFRQSTVSAGGHSCVKDLAPLGRDLRRTVLVDNSPFSFLLQPACGVPAHPFDGDGADTHLLESVLPLLRELASDPALDVRPLLSRRFGMASWLAARGGWALYEAPCGNLAVATGYCSPSPSTPARCAPSTPEMRGDKGGEFAAGEQRRRPSSLPRREAAAEEFEFEFEDLSRHSSSSSWRPSTPTTPQAQEHRPSSHLRPLGAAVSMDSPLEPAATVDEDERMMAIEVAA
jgi:RNA polymerase II subunit A small phosphatase-like protein